MTSFWNWKLVNGDWCWMYLGVEETRSLVLINVVVECRTVDWWMFEL